MTENYQGIYIYKRIVQAKLFMDTHYSDAIDLGNIADEAYFSKFHFIRLFKTLYGKAPHQYLTEVRMENAKKLLEKGFSVADACFSVGFESISSFTGRFKRYSGYPPAEYQKRFKHRKEQIKELPLQFIPTCFAEQN